MVVTRARQWRFDMGASSLAIVLPGDSRRTTPLPIDVSGGSLGAVRLNHLGLACGDVARSLAFYGGLGLRPIVIEDDPDGVPRSVRLVAPDGDATLSLEPAEADADGRQPVRTTTLFFECDDLDARVDALAKAGYVFTAPLEMKPWLWREAELVDPDGNRVRLYHAGSYRRDPPWRLAGSAPAARAGDAANLGSEAFFEASFEVFLAARNHGYADAPIPTARDQELGARLEALIAGAAAERDAAASRLGPAYTATLLAFAERMATTAARERQGRPALLGLVALGLGWREAADVRDAVPVLGLLHDAAARAGADPQRLFQDAAALCPADVAGVFRDFLTRPDLDGIAAEMGYVASKDRDGFRYRRQWGRGVL
jgi:catechol 2,3-dioxygenase-like lactoylglutathione lyase family enzyme